MQFYSHTESREQRIMTLVVLQPHLAAGDHISSYKLNQRHQAAQNVLYLSWYTETYKIY